MKNSGIAPEIGEMVFAENKIASLIAGAGIVNVFFGASMLNIVVPGRTWLPVTLLIVGHVLLLCGGLIMFALAGLRNMFHVSLPWLYNTILFSFQSVMLALMLPLKKDEFIVRFLISDIAIAFICGILCYFIAKRQEQSEIWDELDGYTKKLHTVLSEKDGDYVSAAENLMTAMMNTGGNPNPGVIPRLLTCIDDNEEYEEEITFSIIHAIESFDDRTYCRELLSSLPELYAHAPECCYLLHIRIVNSPECVAVYAKYLKNASPQAKEVLKKILQQMAAEDPDKTEKASLLYNALNVVREKIQQRSNPTNK